MCGDAHHQFPLGSKRPGCVTTWFAPAGARARRSRLCATSSFAYVTASVAFWHMHGLTGTVPPAKTRLGALGRYGGTNASCQRVKVIY